MAALPPVLTLAVTKGPRKGDTRQCRAGAVLRVGRVVSGNDLAVRDAGASQRHLAIEFLPPPASRWAVSDLGSSNGTLLNGAPLVPTVPAPLSDGDLIKIGEDTVLAVSIAFDLHPNQSANPGPRRSSRHPPAAAVLEEKPPVATRRGGRKKAAAEPRNAEKEKPDAVEVVEAAEKPPVVPRRGGRKNAAAPAEAPNAEKEEPDAVEVVEAAEKPAVVPRRGARKIAAVAEPSEAGTEEPKEAAAATRRGGRRKTAEPSELEKEEGKEEEVAAVMRRRGGRKKDSAIAAPPPPFVKTRSGRGQGRVTRASARKTVHEDEDEEVQEVAAPIEEAGNPPRARAAKGGDAEEHGVAAGDGELEVTTKALEGQEPVARRGRTRRAPKGWTNAWRAASDNEVEREERGGEEEEDDGKRDVIGSGGEVGHGVAAGNGEQEGTTKASEEEEPVAWRGQARRAPKGRANAQPAASDNEDEEEKGGGEEEDGKKDVIGSGGEVGDGGKVEPAGRSSLETMTLREWFERMEKYLPRMINEAADEMIASLQERHRRVDEYISTIEESSGPA